MRLPNRSIGACRTVIAGIGVAAAVASCTPDARSAFAPTVQAAGGNSASATSAASFTYQLSEITETVRVANPCLGPMTGTLTYSGVVHVTVDGDLYHAVVAVHGNNVVVPDDPSAPSYSGPFAEVQTLELNRANAVQTFTVTSGSPAMQFHITFQLVLDFPSGVTVSALNVSCGP